MSSVSCFTVKVVAVPLMMIFQVPVSCIVLTRVWSTVSMMVLPEHRRTSFSISCAERFVRATIYLCIKWRLICWGTNVMNRLQPLPTFFLTALPTFFLTALPTLLGLRGLCFLLSYMLSIIFLTDMGFLEIMVHIWHKYSITSWCRKCLW